jgi:hypothetical protein
MTPPGTARRAILLLVPLVFFCCGDNPGGVLTTRAKLQNLKVFMAQVSVLAAQDEVAFPEGTNDLLDLLEQEGGEAVPRGETDPENPLVDGWGTLMVFRGNPAAYEVRSAGADRILDTADDLYLQGDPGGEFIVDGSGARLMSGKDFTQQINPLPFEESHGYYELKLPGSYTVLRNHSGERSQVVFSYARDVRVTITAEPEAASWEPDKALERRLEVLRRGEDELYRDFTVTTYQTVTLGETVGFSVSMEKGHVLVREFRLIRSSVLDLTITIVASGADGSSILEALDQAVRDSLIVHD